MSIYLVRLSEWFLPAGEDLGLFEVANAICKSQRCLACDSKVRWKSAIGHHSLPFGYGDLYCSWKCVRSGKVAEPDYRRERRHKRRMAKEYRQDTELLISIFGPDVRKL